MDFSTIIKAVPVPRAGRGGQTPPDLQPGDKLVGKVLQLESDGRVLIDLGGSRILARVGFAVKPAQTLRLTVVESGPRLHLRAHRPAAHCGRPRDSRADRPAALTAGERQALMQSIGRLMLHLAAKRGQPAVTGAIVHALDQIKTAFDPLPLEKPAVEIARWLRNALENHGGLFEKRLADTEKAAPPAPMDHSTATMRGSENPVRAVIARDMKAQLIILKRFLAGGDARQPVATKVQARETALLRSSVEKMLQHIEQQQERAVTRFREGEPFQCFSHLLPTASRRPPVRLKVYYPRKDGKEGTRASQRIALLLDMDRLGLVRGDIAKVAGGLQIHFFVCDEEVGNYFRAQLGKLEAALEGGFGQIRVDVSVSSEKIARFHHEDLPGAASVRIDIKA